MEKKKFLVALIWNGESMLFIEDAEKEEDLIDFYEANSENFIIIELTPTLKEVLKEELFGREVFNPSRRRIK